jgi:hypothetical protein
MGTERSAFHPGQECFTPSKAVYICADQRLDIAHIQERDTTGRAVNLIMVPLDDSFGRMSTQDQQRQSQNWNRVRMQLIWLVSSVRYGRSQGACV